MPECLLESLEARVQAADLTGKFSLQFHDSSSRGSRARSQRHHGGSAETRSEGKRALFITANGSHGSQTRLVFAGERTRHARSDGVAPRGHGRPPPDLPAVAGIRGGRLPGVAAGFHRCSDGERSSAADTQRCVNSEFVCSARSRSRPCRCGRGNRPITLFFVSLMSEMRICVTSSSAVARNTHGLAF